MGPWLRLVARLVDGLVVGIPLAILLAILGIGDRPFTTDLGDVVGTLLSAIASVAYFVVMESGSGGTVGKKAIGARVVGPAGGNPTPEQALRRNLYLLAGIVPVIGPLASIGLAIAIGVTISNDPAKRGFHDHFAGGTTVVR